LKKTPSNNGCEMIVITSSSASRQHPLVFSPPPPSSVQGGEICSDISVLHGHVSSLGDQSLLSAQTTQSNLEATITSHNLNYSSQFSVVEDPKRTKKM
jgi:hypothetical protein